MLYQAIKTLFKVAAPLSLAYNNIPSRDNYKEIPADIFQGIQPGDIIITKTPALLYEFSRAFVQSQYDHIAVAISKTQVIHVSPPVISKLKTHNIVREDRCPIIYRPDLTPQQKKKFLQTLNSFFGEKYNVKAIYSITLQEIKRKISLSKQDSEQDHPRINFSYVTLKYSKICSDTILYALCLASEKNRELITNIIDTQTLYHCYGFTMPDDMIKVMKGLNYELYYQSPTKYEQSTVFKFLRAVQAYPTKSKLHELFVQHPKEFINNNSESIKKIFQTINPKNLLKSRNKMKYLNQFFDYYEVYFKITFLLAMVFKIVEYLGYKPSDNFSKTLNVATIALIILTFSIPFQQHNQIDPKM